MFLINKGINAAQKVIGIQSEFKNRERMWKEILNLIVICCLAVKLGDCKRLVLDNLM